MGCLPTCLTMFSSGRDPRATYSRLTTYFCFVSPPPALFMCRLLFFHFLLSFSARSPREEEDGRRKEQGKSIFRMVLSDQRQGRSTHERAWLLFHLFWRFLCEKSFFEAKKKTVLIATGLLTYRYYCITTPDSLHGLKLEPLFDNAGPFQGRQEGCQEEGDWPIHSQGLVWREGAIHLQGSRCRKDTR